MMAIISELLPDCTGASCIVSCLQHYYAMGGTFVETKQSGALYLSRVHLRFLFYYLVNYSISTVGYPLVFKTCES